MISEILVLNKTLRKKNYIAFPYPISVFTKNVFFVPTQLFHLKICTIFTVCCKASVDLLQTKMLHNQDKVILHLCQLKNARHRKKKVKYNFKISQLDPFKSI